MKPHSNIQKSRHGIYYFRLQRYGLDRRISLHTKDLFQAQIAAAICHATIQKMAINESKIKNWVARIKGDEIEIITDNSDADRASATEALVAIVKAKRAPLSEQLVQKINDEKHKARMPIAAAFSLYEVHLANSKIAIKSQRMAFSTIKDLINALGSQFDMAEITDDVVEEKWLKPRLSKVAETTAKRDLSFIRSFIDWSADKKRRFTPAPLTLSIEAEGKSWSYLNSNDLRLIFDNLPQYSENPWQFWVPLIALYTGARIAEITSLKTNYVFDKAGIHALKIAGTKTKSSVRDIPIHQDLLQLGFLEFVTARRNARKEYLFDIKHHNQNGAGATVSKWYTAFKKEIGLNDEMKVFHSFRPTIVDHLKQAGASFEARCQYVGHDAGGGIHNKIYGRNELNLRVIKTEVVEKIDWLKYCGWKPDLKVLKSKADALLK